MRLPRSDVTPDGLILWKLVDEVDGSDPREAEKRIRRSFRYYEFAPASSERIALLRTLCRKVKDEIGGYSTSTFFKRPEQRRGDVDDYDVEGLVEHFSKAFPEVELTALRWFIPWVIYLCYLR